MKAKFAFLTLLVILCLAAVELPPALPSSFWGYTSQPGVVTVYVNGHQVNKVATFTYQGKPVYALDVSLDNVNPATTAAFYLNGRFVKYAPLASGTNTRLDLVTKARLWR